MRMARAKRLTPWLPGDDEVSTECREPVVITRADVPAGKLWLTSEEAAALLEVSRDVIRDWLTTGITINTRSGRKRIALNGRKIGGRWKVRPDDLEAFVKATTDASLSPDAVRPDDTETDAQFRRRAKRAKEELAKRLGG